MKMNWEYSLHGAWNFTLGSEEAFGRTEIENRGKMDSETIQNIKSKGHFIDTTESRLSVDTIDFIDTIQIPGILQAQGYGEDVTEHTPWISSLHDKLWYEREEYKTEGKAIHIPFLSQPPKHYLGKAWYQKTFAIPENIGDCIFYLELECVKWKTSLWLDAAYIGSETALCTSHIYCLGALEAGEHTIVLCVDNSLQYPYRPDGHMVSDALGATWNGIAGKVSVKAVPMVHMENIQVYPNVETKTVLVLLSISNHTGLKQTVQFQINNTSKTVDIEESEQMVTVNIEYPQETACWDEYSPVLHRIRAILKLGEQIQEEEVTFGFRKIETKEGRFYLNNRPAFFRGTHSGGDFPLTGYPSTEVYEWKKIIRTCKEWGLNYIRFHSFCPPKAAFVAADEEGLYLQVECGMWNHFYEGCNMNEVLWEETKRIIKQFGNHPSFVMLSPSNEPGGDWYKPLRNWVKQCKEIDSRRVYTAQSGWPYPVTPDKIEGMDYVYFHRSGFGIQPGGTIRNSQGWHGKDYRLSVEGIQYPVVSHELGQWCSYPDFELIDKFTGYLKPGNFIAFRESARRQGVLSQNKEFAHLSGKLKVQLYKEEIEATFRTPHLYGFELLELHDYIGQGTALVGMLDPFWEEKSFVTANEFKGFCQETVPLLRLPKRIYKQHETLKCLLEFCHFGKEEIKDAIIYWEVLNAEGNTVINGVFSGFDIPLCKNYEIGEVEVNLQDLPAPAEYEIVVGIKDTTVRNSWRIWLYEAPANAKDLEEEAANKVTYTRSLKVALQALEDGRRVIYSPLPEHHRLDSPPVSVRPSFWNSQMGPTYSRGMGLVIRKDHPALALFPTREYQEWQWEEIIQGANGLNLSDFPAELMPIVQPIDEYTRNYRLGMILEGKVLKGSLLIVTADLDKDIDNRPVAGLLKQSLLAYAASDAFLPEVQIEEEVLIKAFFPRNIMANCKTQVRVLTDSCGTGTENFHKDDEIKDDIISIIDGNPNTFYTSEKLSYPFTLELSPEKELTIKGLLYMARQNEREHKGDIKGCRIQAFIDGDWQVVYDGNLVSSYAPIEILFSKEVTTDKVRFTGLYGFSAENIPVFTKNKEGWYLQYKDYADTTAAIAELLFIPAGSSIDYLDEAAKTLQKSEKLKSKEEFGKSATKEIEY
ncbi:beta-galactosidase [Anaerocolumna cellulosilytica]|uniref:Beta-galactosidase n=1 Tax=Anaerocolumna cellulosilytica TaxID=433286 RepID=A0A6S6R7T6_9FIRM|nr:discoidin domain-containing protein [Anaerocolumna cellulosilytica]MBB5198010.1 hypothetical protein [Anaerocolumna cellulosilytica]BCJ95530.1 beta-galactosidase [Anaerocolumna cellulosilytica]